MIFELTDAPPFRPYWTRQCEPEYTVVFYFYDEWHRFEYNNYIKWVMVND